MRHKTFTSIKPSLCLTATQLLMTFFSYVSNLTQYSFTLNLSVKCFSNIKSSLDPTNVTFLKTRFKYVGHGVTEAGNSPDQSKFDLINKWILPLIGKSLLSFIEIVNFYHCYDTCFELKWRPLRKFIKQYYQKPTPMIVSNSQLIRLFAELKHGMISSPLLALFDPDKPTFLKENGFHKVWSRF